MDPDRQFYHHADLQTGATTGLSAWTAAGNAGSARCGGARGRRALQARVLYYSADAVEPDTPHGYAGGDHAARRLSENPL